MSDKCYFHFTIGPVQDFVSQARRTRDYWAGSFLLSWLSAVAMQAVIAQAKTKPDETIQFPKPDKGYLKWLTKGKDGTSKKPRQGRVPNRFKAKVDCDFDAKVVVKSVQDAWKAIADLVYNNDIGADESTETYKIWKRQIKHF